MWARKLGLVDKRKNLIYIFMDMVAIAITVLEI